MPPKKKIRIQLVLSLKKRSKDLDKKQDLGLVVSPQTHKER